MSAIHPCTCWRRTFDLPPRFRLGDQNMSVKGTAAYGMYPRNVPLLDVVSALNQAGFQNEDICMVLSPAHPVATGVGAGKMGGGEREESGSHAGMVCWF